MTTSALSVIDRGAGTAVAQMQARMQTITQVMANVLEEGKDYGKIPGTDKPTLYKPGAEKLMLTFALAAAEPHITDLSTGDEVRYRVSVPIQAIDGHILAVGVGEASTNEEKYRWRKPVCDEEFQETPESYRRVKWFRGQGGKTYQGQQIRTSPADLANTVLKMAHKRGFVHGTLLATGASSVFNQDLEDFTKELHENMVDDDGTGEKPKVKRASETKKAAGITGLITEPRKVKDVKAAGKDKTKPSFWVLVLEGDAQEYTTKDAKFALDLDGFKGTDHALRVTYEDNEWNGKTYHNIKGFSVDAPPTTTEAPAGPTTASSGPLTAGDIPFGR